MLPPIVDKLIITNLDALTAKYGTGVATVRVAVQKLIAADKARGLNDKLIDLGDAAAMSKYGLAAIPAASSGNAQLNKDAIDAIYIAHDPRPAYLLLLGATDVIPHVPLDNPMLGDGDPDVPSDLPYACDRPYSVDAQDFIQPTRVVGRLPNVNKDTSPAYLVRLLGFAASYTQRPATDYDPFLGVSAQVWQASTGLSLSAIFGGTVGMRVSPTDGPRWSVAQLNKRLSHFVNCHGAPADPDFYGQKGSSYPVAHSASWMSTRVLQGTVMAAECCYGAELYDPALPTAMGQMGMCNTYLGQGSYAYFGSSNIAYGPAAANDQADLMCRYFLQQIRAGASSGRACLQARLSYVTGKGGLLLPVDLKTLAQFNLMSDPSLTPVSVAAPTASASKTAQAQRALERHERQRRRVALATKAAGVPVQRLESIGSSPASKGASLAKLKRLAREHGLDAPDVFISFSVVPAAATAKGFAAHSIVTEGQGPKAVHAVLQRMKPPSKLPHLPILKVVQAIEYADATEVSILLSR